MSEDLVCFLYLLMRDTVVPGEVARLAKEVTKCAEDAKTYTNKYLEAYARELAATLS